ncbi:MAG: cellulase family glycosylhydrolase [Bacteroidetes bacterium]|nr:cellulase family glycosylhydrolase [Bacteroidota bacterium]
MKTLLTLLAFLLVSLPLSAQFVSVKGKNYIDPDGKVLFLRGTNLGNWLVPEGYMFKFKKTGSPSQINQVLTELIGPEETDKFWTEYYKVYTTEGDIQQIKKLGFNHIRVPFNFRLVMNETGSKAIKPDFFPMMDKLLTWCEKAGIYVVFDMHCAPGGQTGDNIDDSFGFPWLFDSPDMQDRAILIWTEFAKRYQDRTIVIGYDLLNEPIAHYFNADTLNPKLEPLYKRMTAAVREFDKNHLIFLGGAQWDSNFKPFGKPFDDKLVYTFHKYWTAPDVSVIQDYLDFSEKYQVPLWMGESGENKNEWIATFTQTLETNNVSWCYWPYKKMDAESSPMTFKKPADWDLIVNFAESDRSTFENIRKNRPDQKKVREILKELLENCKAENATVNQGYVKALGLKYQ